MLGLVDHRSHESVNRLPGQAGLQPSREEKNIFATTTKDFWRYRYDAVSDLVVKPFPRRSEIQDQ